VSGNVVSWVVGQLDIGAEATVTLQMKSVRKDTVTTGQNLAHATCLNTNLIAQIPVPDTDSITLNVSLLEPQVYPSPFNPSKAVGGVLKFSQLPNDSRVTILGISGRKIRVLTGVVRHRLEWDGKNEAGDDVAAGFYLYVIEMTDDNGVKKTVKGRFGLIR